MKENLKNAIVTLKQRIRFNLDLIKQNENLIKEILKEPVSQERSKKLNGKFELNKKLIQENNDSLKLQREIISYLDKYKTNFSESNEVNKINNYLEQSDSEDEILEINKEDYFELTVNGELVFDSQHPYFNDESFLNDLLLHFISLENYEMCAQLKERKNKRSIAR